jgi:sugar phosphate isomerase/epimerase
MAELLVSRFAESKTKLQDEIPTYQGIPIQVGFYNPGEFFNYDHIELNTICEDNGVRVKSVHTPTVNFPDGEMYFDMLETIRDSYNVDNVTIHPTRANPLDAFKFFRKKTDRLDELGMVLMYENFDSDTSNKRWLPRAKNIVTSDLPYVFLTYDTSHIDLHTHILSELEDFSRRLGMVHLSNRTKDQKHLPVHEGSHDLDPVIDFLSDLDVFVTLEYHGREERLIEDYHSLKERIEKPHFSSL